ncbi:unnamed protein product, partial [Discosporangium mesarthrocarpum]
HPSASEFLLGVGHMSWAFEHHPCGAKAACVHRPSSSVSCMYEVDEDSVGPVPETGDGIEIGRPVLNGAYPNGEDCSLGDGRREQVGNKAQEVKEEASHLKRAHWFRIETRSRRSASQRQVPSPTATNVNRIRDLGRRRRWQDALAVVDSVPNPPEEVFNAAISVCEKCRRPREALQMHWRMVAAGVTPRPESILPVMRAFLLSGDPAMSLELFQQYITKRQLEAGPVKDTFHEESKSLMRLYAEAIRSCQRLGDWMEAVRLYREAEGVQGGSLRPGSAASVFNTCYFAKQYGAAVAFIEDALAPSPLTTGLVRDRRRLLMNKAIVACGRAGPDHHSMALRIYEDMGSGPPQGSRVGIDNYTRTAIIDVLRRGPDWRRALPILEDLARASGRPGGGHGRRPGAGLQTALNAVLDPLSRVDYRGARALVERARREWGFEPDEATYGTLLLAASTEGPGVHARGGGGTGAPGGPGQGVGSTG